MNPIPCITCGEEGHRAHRCPSLCAPLQSGFYAPPAGARQGGDDEDDSSSKRRALPKGRLVRDGTYSTTTPSGGGDEKLNPVPPVLTTIKPKCLNQNFKWAKWSPIKL